MSEMLANYYFQKRDYHSAMMEFEKLSNPSELSKTVKKKMLICYTQEKKIKEALELFGELVSTDINIILQTNHEEELCPCPELVYEYENQSFNQTDDYEHNLTLGILWLYCSINKSFEYLYKANRLMPENRDIQRILKIISNQILLIEENQNHN